MVARRVGVRLIFINLGILFTILPSERLSHSMWRCVAFGSVRSSRFGFLADEFLKGNRSKYKWGLSVSGNARCSKHSALFASNDLKLVWWVTSGDAPCPALLIISSDYASQTESFLNVLSPLLNCAISWMGGRLSNPSGAFLTFGPESCCSDGADTERCGKLKIRNVMVCATRNGSLVALA